MIQVRGKLFAATVAMAGLLALGGTATAAAPDQKADNPAPATTSAAAPQKSGKAAADPQAGGKVAAAAAVCEYPVNVAVPDKRIRTITSSDARYYYNDVAWQDLGCGSLDIVIPRGKTAGILARTSGELTCTHTDGVDTTQWCLGRIQINYTDAYPVETEADGSFAWAQSSSDYAAWEANIMERSRTVRCPENATADCKINVNTQVRNHAPNLEFRVDGTHMTVEAHVY